MDPADRLQILNALEENQPRLRRRSQRIAWLTLAVAAIVLAAMIGAASSRLRSIQAEVATTRTALDNVERQRADKLGQVQALETEIAALQTQRKGLQEVLAAVPATQRESAVQQAIERNPATAAAVPRVYVHVVSTDPRDRAYAETIADALRKGGLLVVSIQTIPGAAALRASDVRYHNQNDEREARRILKLVQDAGETGAQLNPKLEYANDPKAANRFEVWLTRRGA